MSEDEDSDSQGVRKGEEKNEEIVSDEQNITKLEDNGERDEDNQIQEIDRHWPPPVEKNIELIGSSNGKTVSAFAFDNAGSRFAAGGHDHGVKIWDFGAMNRMRPVPIASVQPSGGAVINHLEFSPNDELILVIPGNTQAILMARDGIVDSKQGICAKGDQYIADMANTKGHVQMLNHGCWRPKDNGEFITCSNDATIRIWNPDKLSQQKTVIKTRSPVNGLKTIPNVCRYSRDALTIVAGCQDGTVMMWDTRRKFIATSGCIRNAHLKGSEITGLDYSYDMTKLCSRSDDESCKLWDLRQLKRALATRTGLTTLYSTTDCCFSPDDRVVVTGTSGTEQQGGEVLFMDSSNLASRRSLGIGAGASVLRVRWHPKINHLAYTSSDGQVHVTYDSQRSLGGGFALLLSESAASAGQQRGRKRKNFAYDTIAGAASSGAAEAAASNSGQAIKRIITPHALPLFRDDANNKSGSGANSGGAAFASATASRMRSDPKRSYKPEAPASASQGGRAAAVKPAGSTLSSYIARSLAKPGGA